MKNFMKFLGNRLKITARLPALILRISFGMRKLLTIVGNHIIMKMYVIQI